VAQQFAGRLSPEDLDQLTASLRRLIDTEDAGA
jgi:hypothetical protein